MNKQCILYTDGACSGNPGVGGWAYSLHINIDELINNNVNLIDNEKALCILDSNGYDSHTTNNKMELTSVIRGLSKALSFKCVQVTLYTDSTYVQLGLTKWLNSWVRNNWQTSDKKEVKNIDLWQELYDIKNKILLEVIWVKAHSGNYWNEHVDKLAKNIILVQ